MTPARKAAAVILVLGGTAQRLAMANPPQARIQGGQTNRVQADPLTYLMHTVAGKYSPLGEETGLKAMAGVFHFDRRPGESIEDVLAKFGITRQTAVNDGGIGVKVENPCHCF